MTNHDLYRTIGQADEAFLLECEEVTVRRLPRRFGLIAAMFALLLTACAAPAIQAFHALQEGTVVETGECYGFHELDASVYEIWTDIDIAQDAPTSIETVYLPTAMENYGGKITLDKKEWALSFYCMPRGFDAEEYVDFHQVAFPAYTRTGQRFVLGEFHANPSAEPAIRKLTFENVTVLDIIHESPAHDAKTGAYYVQHRTVYWSNGSYLFFMNLPVSWSDTEIQEMVESLSVVEDISGYPAA